MEGPEYSTEEYCLEEAWVAITFPLESATETSPVELPLRFVNTDAWVELSEGDSGDSAMPEAPIAHSPPPVTVNPDCTSTEPFPPTVGPRITTLPPEIVPAALESSPSPSESIVTAPPVMVKPCGLSPEMLMPSSLLVSRV